MFNRVIAPLLGVIFVASFSLSGCSPANQSGSALMGSADGRQSNASSSLEALRRGQFPSQGPLNNVYFDFDRYDLSADARETLKANARWLNANPSTRVEIEGHCDERGTNEYNLALGALRAQVTKDYLMSLGISEERLSTISLGEEVPVCKDQSENCWQQNRHSRFVVTPGPVS